MVVGGETNIDKILKYFPQKEKNKKEKINSFSIMR